MSIFVDISLPVSAGMPVYPGTSPTTFTTKTSKNGNMISDISLTSHAGTHVDAPLHALPGAPAVDQIPLDVFYGRCRVLDLTNVAEAIMPADLQSFKPVEGERLLLKTKNSERGFEEFYEDYMYLSSEAAEYLAAQHIQLVGIDSLSVKQLRSADNSPHTSLLSEGIPILEGLDLRKAEPGEYILSAFPLAFVGIDGAPLRAILISG